MKHRKFAKKRLVRKLKAGHRQRAFEERPRESYTLPRIGTWWACANPGIIVHVTGHDGELVEYREVWNNVIADGGPTPADQVQRRLHVAGWDGCIEPRESRGTYIFKPLDPIHVGQLYHMCNTLIKEYVAALSPDEQASL